MKSRQLIAVALLMVISASLTACQITRGNNYQSKQEMEVERRYIERDFNLQQQTTAPARVYRLR